MVVLRHKQLKKQDLLQHIQLAKTPMATSKLKYTPIRQAYAWLGLVSLILWPLFFAYVWHVHTIALECINL